MLIKRIFFNKHMLPSCSSNKCMLPTKMSVNIHHSTKSCPYSAWLIFVSLPICRIVSATWECLYSTSWCSSGMGMVRLIKESLTDSRQFLLAMASNHRSMIYKQLLKKNWVHIKLAGHELERSNVPTMGGAKISLSIKRTPSNRHIFPYHREW